MGMSCGCTGILLPGKNASFKAPVALLPPVRNVAGGTAYVLTRASSSSVWRIERRSARALQRGLAELSKAARPTVSVRRLEPQTTVRLEKRSNCLH